MKLRIEDGEGESPEGSINSDHPLAEFVPMERSLAEQPKEGEL
jgi:hypothetical protein